MDNFDLLRPLLWNRENINGINFYHIYIIQRRKDDGNTDMNITYTTIRNYYVYNEKDYDLLKPKIEKACKDNNARAYIVPNIKNSERIALETMKLVAEYICSKNHKAVENAYEHSVARHNGEILSRWIVDIDYKEMDNINTRLGINKTQEDIENDCKNIILKLGSKILLTVPTKNGKHWIVNPFRLDEWKKTPYGYGVNKNGGTLLYI